MQGALLGPILFLSITSCTCAADDHLNCLANYTVCWKYSTYTEYNYNVGLHAFAGDVQYIEPIAWADRNLQNLNDSQQ